MKRKAVYAGTFDPPTLGHLWVMEQAANMCDELVVAIGLNPNKQTTFTVLERLAMLKSMTSHLPHVSVASIPFDLLVNNASTMGAQFMIRGIRNPDDQQKEQIMRDWNEKINPAIMTIFLTPPPDLAKVSSSVLKEIFQFNGGERVASGYLTKPVLKKMLVKKFTLWRNISAIGGQVSEDDFWDDLLVPYMDEARGHHNWKHLCNFFSEYHEVENLLEDPLAVELAAGYHDREYAPWKKIYTSGWSDEEESAKHAAAMIDKLKLRVVNTFGDKVRDLILKGTSHKIVLVDHDQQYMRDMDLAIFGRPEQEFDEYEAGIRKEYSFVAPAEFVARRVSILEKFLNFPGIYYTEYFRNKYRAQAEYNLRRSIAKLTSA